MESNNFSYVYTTYDQRHRVLKRQFDWMIKNNVFDTKPEYVKDMVFGNHKIVQGNRIYDKWGQPTNKYEQIYLVSDEEEKMGMTYYNYDYIIMAILMKK